MSQWAGFVYRSDRRPQSLADFAKIVEILDRHASSIVSVTQRFTTMSMGPPDLERAACPPSLKSGPRLQVSPC
jgi:hypothetical protein